MSQSKEILDILKAKEKLIYDTWITKKGISVTISPVTVIDELNAPVQQDLDPFATTTIKNISIQHENIITNAYGADILTKMIMVNESFELMDFSLEMMITELSGTNELDNNFNNVKAYIGGGLIPNGSIITFTEYTNIKLFVRNIQKKRPISDIFIYTLSRT